EFSRCRPDHRAPGHGQESLRRSEGREWADPDLFARKRTRSGSDGDFQTPRSWRFDWCRRNVFHDQDRRVDVESAQAGGAGEIVATVTGKMARLAGHRGPVSAALSRSDHERSIT